MIEQGATAGSLDRRTQRAITLLTLVSRLYMVIEITLASASIYLVATTSPTDAALATVVIEGIIRIAQGVLVYAVVRGLAVLIEHASNNHG